MGGEYSKKGKKQEAVNEAIPETADDKLLRMEAEKDKALDQLRDVVKILKQQISILIEAMARIQARTASHTPKSQIDKQMLIEDVLSLARGVLEQIKHVKP